MEQVIISLTTWSARINNIPAVLDSIFHQTVLPDKVVLNLAYDTEIPNDIAKYIQHHHVEIFYTEDTKVWKKLVPTLRRYPNACIINIDDDWLYPPTMIEDFIKVHERFPQNPISGNRSVECGLVCHCGCASLTKAEYFGQYLTIVDDEFINHCASDDMVYTYLATKNNHPYVRTAGVYFDNMVSYNQQASYSEQHTNKIIDETYSYLVNRFGEISPRNTLSSFIIDDSITDMLVHWVEKNITDSREKQRNIDQEIKEQTKAYQLGKFLLHPSLKRLKMVLNRKS